MDRLRSLTGREKHPGQAAEGDTHLSSGRSMNTTGRRRWRLPHTRRGDATLSKDHQMIEKGSALRHAWQTGCGSIACVPTVALRECLVCSAPLVAVWRQGAVFLSDHLYWRFWLSPAVLRWDLATSGGDLRSEPVWEPAMESLIRVGQGAGDRS